jgi:DNA-binding LytR/AlgR family response regulator
LKRLEFLLGRIPGVQLVGTAGNADEALRQIASLKPDIVLLQVELSGMNGFELVESLAGGSIPQIIFVTAFDEFATRAFEVGATDYIVKPLDLDRLTVAIGKARSALEAAEAQLRIAELRAVVDALRSERPAPPRKRDTEVWAQRRGSFVRVSAETIDWIEADRDYVHIHVGEDSYLLRETLSGLHKRLGADRFVRIRRSALVKADKIESIRRAGPSDFRVTLVGGRELRVGITFVKAVRQMLSSGAGALDTAAGPGGSGE